MFEEYVFQLIYIMPFHIICVPFSPPIQSYSYFLLCSSKYTEYIT